MYLVSLYFDSKTENKIQGIINKVAYKCGNNFMIDNNVPPHITISAFQSDEEERVVEILDKMIKNNIKSEIITFASIGSFKSSVIFLAPILNEYLHELSENIYEGVYSLKDVSISKFYLPFQWMPHITIAKKLTREELFLAFEELDKNFTMFNGNITKISLSKTKPLRDIAVWTLNNY